MVWSCRILLCDARRPLLRRASGLIGLRPEGIDLPEAGATGVIRTGERSPSSRRGSSLPLFSSAGCEALHRRSLRHRRSGDCRDDAHFTGTVTTALFLGDRTRLILSASGRNPIVVDTRDRRAFAVGAEVPVRIRPDGLMVVPAGSEAP
jgi:hypothetical protein